MSKNNCANAVTVARIVKDLGGTVVGIIPSGTKHLKLEAVTRQGNSLTISLSKGKSDPVALVNWTRQAFNRADRKANS